MSTLTVLNLPPTSLKSYSAYVKRTTTLHGIPTWCAVTEFSFDPDSDWPSIVAQYRGMIGKEDMQMLAASKDKFYAMVSTPYDVSSYVPLEHATSVEGAKKSKMS
jgi:hypothetical protein